MKPKGEDEGVKVTVPKERAGRRGIGGGLNTETEKNVQEKGTNGARGEGMAGKSL